MAEGNGAPKGIGIGRSLIYACGEFGNNLVNLVFAGWILYFYTNDTGRDKPLISMYAMTAILIGGRIIDGLADPLVGYWSDNTKTRIGRRRPFIFIGTPLMVLAFVTLFRPVFPAGSTALVVFTGVLMCTFWFFYSTVAGPYLSLLPEIAETSRQRVALATFMAVAMLLATGYQMIAASNMVDATKWNLGYFNMALITGGISFVFMYIVAIGIREKNTGPPAQTGDKSEKYSMTDAFRWTFKNPAFVSYIISSFCFKLGFASLMASLPYIVTRLMGKTESFVGTVAMITIPGFIVSFLIFNYLTRIYGKVVLYKICLALFAIILPFLFVIGRIDVGVDPGILGMIMMGVLSFPIAGDMILPKAILADIADYDEKQTGFRREAMYFGMQGLLQKIATSFSKGLSGLLFGYFGYSMSNHLGINLLGPVAGACGLIGFLIFLTYPIDDRPKK